jgi:hypothetical protein
MARTHKHDPAIRAAAAEAVAGHLAAYPGLSAYELARVLGLTVRRAQTAVEDLEAAGRVTGEQVRGTGGWRTVWSSSKAPLPSGGD